MSQNHLRDLEEDHFAADLFYDAVGGLEGCDEARFNLIRFDEILGQVVEEIDNQIITLRQIDKQILRLRQEKVLWVGHHHHLRLLQRRFEIVELHVVVVCQERDLDSLA